MNEEPDNDRNDNIRILCLHGKWGSGQTFKKFLHSFEEELQFKFSSLADPKIVQFDYLNAPFRIEEGGHGIDPNKREWWTLPPGVRSFDAKEYVGFQKSSELVQRALIDHDYDFILCHSQGSILMSSLMSDPTWTRATFGAKEPSKRPKGYILNGCAWPNPYGELLENFQQQQDSCLSIDCSPAKVLFVMAEDDPVNPTKGAERVRDCFIKGGLDVETCYHKGEHSLPVKDKQSIEKISSWIIKAASIIAGSRGDT